LTWLVRVVNAGLKVADFSVICRELARVAAKGLREAELKVDPSTTLPSRLRVNRARSLKLNGERFGELNAETQSTQRSETGTDLEIEVGLAASPSFLPSFLRASRTSMGNGSTDFDYCQGNGTIIYHSNVRRGSGVDGRSWGEFCSLVRRIASVCPCPPSPLAP